MKKMLWRTAPDAAEMCASRLGDIANADKYSAKLMRMFILVDGDIVLQSVEWAVNTPTGEVLPMPATNQFPQRNCKILFEEEVVFSDEKFALSQIVMKPVIDNGVLKYLPITDEQTSYATYTKDNGLVLQ